MEKKAICDQLQIFMDAWDFQMELEHIIRRERMLRMARNIVDDEENIGFDIDLIKRIEDKAMEDFEANGELRENDD